MSLPAESDLVMALVRSLQLFGRPASVAEQDREVARVLGLNPDETSELHDGNRTKFSYRLAWVRTYLKTLGIMRSTQRGVWELTPKGASVHNFYDVASADADGSLELLEDSGAVEGLDESTPDEFGEYPIDSVLIRQETRTVFEIVRRIRDGRFIMDPDFQRDFIWGLDKQSKLIESMMMRIPLPVFYLAERDDGKTVVVDGLQRLTTFINFLDDKFELQNLQLAPELNERRFSRLPTKLQNRLEDTQLILYLIDSKVPEQAKLDIFDRVNGGVPLTRQQMRNSIYNGPATRWLRDEAQTEEFLRATGESLDRKTMRDREFANRFCAFSLLGAHTYTRGDMDAFLAQSLKAMNARAPEELEKLSSDFRRSMRCNYRIFGSHAFRKHRNYTTRRSLLNVALFDVFSVLLARIDEQCVDEVRDRVRTGFFELLDDPAFVDAISSGTNSTAKVQSRFRIATLKLGSSINAHKS